MGPAFSVVPSYLRWNIDSPPRLFFRSSPVRDYSDWRRMLRNDLSAVQASRTAGASVFVRIAHGNDFALVSSIRGIVHDGRVWMLLLPPLYSLGSPRDRLREAFRCFHLAFSVHSNRPD